ncbi:hypothetical protein FC70_GL000177 [Paucilactobacillus oligofermentans DSM 15707 = LMG 22743]|uniref:DUF2628 domain-containing protein n=1 Tax=Paucilactobacillus oligofermentans DSM 15707 = LMG 22743 TaxID=1423778 RepID=A0A0R1RXX4_9LACO|nr:DUF2628 domain-containing protein [Paucilactobacillus oligofermentans]KRL58104.1 hypothetical protein FC70_GL000177 [Paucilactobacillus oligofermentans DSM 15707 = LMG 22743]CUS27013.1 DUF2628-containing protein [Paucilactobacillus oligofermentans DSM 15707 = LMG 22743]
MQDPFNNQNNSEQDPNDPFSGLPIPPNYARIVNKENRQVRIAKVGVSWTTFFFGPLPSVFRGDWYNFALMLVIDVAYGLLLSMLGLEVVNTDTASNLMLILNVLPSIIFSIFYNMMYFRHKFYTGYEPADERSKELLVKAKYWKD